MMLLRITGFKDRQTSRVPHTFEGSIPKGSVPVVDRVTMTGSGGCNTSHVRVRSFTLSGAKLHTFRRETSHFQARNFTLSGAKQIKKRLAKLMKIKALSALGKNFDN